jgi:hypothetical protein
MSTGSPPRNGSSATNIDININVNMSKNNIVGEVPMALIMAN